MPDNFPDRINFNKTYLENGASELKRFLLIVCTHLGTMETFEFFFPNDFNRINEFQRTKLKKLMS